MNITLYERHPLCFCDLSWERQGLKRVSENVRNNSEGAVQLMRYLFRMMYLYIGFKIDI